MVPSGSDALRGDFGSHPSEQELILSYLRPRVASGGDRTWDFIHDADVYTADPADLTREFRPAIASDGEKAWYFFTPLRSKSRRGQRKARTVGSGEGCWHSEHAAKAVVAGVRRSRQIGRRQSFSFVKKEGGQRVRSGWLMVEICLNHGKEEGSADEIVLCKVYRSPRALPARGVKKSTAAVAASGRKRKADDKNSGAARHVRLCSRCRTEPAESQSETADDAVEEDEPPRGRSETGVLEDDSMADESDAPHGDETGDSSENRRNLRATPFYHFM